MELQKNVKFTHVLRRCATTEYMTIVLFGNFDPIINLAFSNFN